MIFIIDGNMEAEFYCYTGWEEVHFKPSCGRSEKRVVPLHILALNLKLPKLSIKNGSDCYCLGGEMLLVPKLS